eukprot:g1529.t1
MHSNLLLQNGVLVGRRNFNRLIFLRRGKFRRPLVVRLQASSTSWDDSDKSKRSKSEDAARHLDLLWDVTARSKPSPCSCCNGTGFKECPFCHGTGVMTVGDALYCSLEGCSKCPVCNSEGLVKCKDCMGTGFRASWINKECTSM